MAARLVAACFSCSLIHPQRPVDFATYTPLELWEDTHLFHDPYKFALPASLLSVRAVCKPCKHQGSPHSTCAVTLACCQSACYCWLAYHDATVCQPLSKVEYVLCALSNMFMAFDNPSGCLPARQMQVPMQVQLRAHDERPPMHHCCAVEK